MLFISEAAGRVKRHDATSLARPTTPLGSTLRVRINATQNNKKKKTKQQQIFRKRALKGQSKLRTYHTHASMTPWWAHTFRNKNGLVTGAWV